MKTQNNLFFPSLEKNEIYELVQDVKETVATNVDPAKKEIMLTAADLWNIHRMGRPKPLRRFLV
jgi:uncharacterized protein (UPF0303 family)